MQNAKSYGTKKRETEEVFIDVAVYEQMLWYNYGVVKWVEAV